MSKEVTRRDFINRTSVATAGLATGLASGCATTGKTDLSVVHTPKRGPNDKIVIGLIGCGGMGRGNMRDMMRHKYVDVAAVCDIDDGHTNEAAKDVVKTGRKEPKKFKDFRKIIDQNDIDVVIVGTPDHWHALPSVLAMMAGKDVYCEKPVSHNIVEGRTMVAAARKYKRVTQIGTQQRSGGHFQRARAIVRSGVLGKITQTYTWNIGNQSPDGIGNPPDKSIPPKGADYDFWLGPAPKRPFNENRFHYKWRWFFDYAAGMIGDWNVHLQDIVHWNMNVDHPISVAAMGGKYALKDNRDTPDTQTVIYEFPGFTQTYILSFVRGHGYDKRGYGIQFCGTEATLHVDRGGFEVYPEYTGKGDKKTARCPVEKSTKQQVRDDRHFKHVTNFLECVKSRKRCICDVEIGNNITTACHLGNIAMKTGRRIYWDHNKGVITDKDGRLDKEATAMLSREYRKPWELPKIT